MLPSILEAAAPIGAARMRSALREKSENPSSIPFTTDFYLPRPLLEYKLKVAISFEHNLKRLL